ncbi:MAG: methylmalonyl-CoA mutase family protein [Candidatus Eisenbacteria bacterium]
MTFTIGLGTGLFLDLAKIRALRHCWAHLQSTWLRSTAGTSGDTGDTGASGASGNTGTSGGTGNTGDTGDTDASGASGNTGTSGDTGNTGSIVSTGPRGATASAGTPKSTGSIVNPGVTGTPGRIATTGAAGDSDLHSPGLAAARVHAVGSERTLTRHDPWTNLLRTTEHGWTAMLAGVDWLTIPPFDALDTGNGLGRRLARNVSNVLREESRLQDVIDPAAGSYAIESLTEQLAAAAWEHVRAIESRGGMIGALTSGWLHDRIAECARKRQEEVAHRRRMLTGISAYAAIEDDSTPTAPGRPGFGDGVHTGTQAGAQTGAQTGTQAGTQAGAQTGKQAGTQAGTQAGAQTGAQSGTPTRGRTGFQTGVDPLDSSDAAQTHPHSGGTEDCGAPLRPTRVAIAFERLRDRADAIARSTGTRPTVFLATLGTPREHAARVGFTRDFLASAGILTTAPPRPSGGRADPAELVARFRESGAEVACLCGTDEAYRAVLPELATVLGQKGTHPILLAGPPDPDRDRSAIGLHLYRGCDAVAALRRVLDFYAPAEEVRS